MHADTSRYIHHCMPPMQMRSVPDTFPDMPSYASSFEWLLVDEVRAQVAQALEALGGMACHGEYTAGASCMHVNNERANCACMQSSS